MAYQPSPFDDSVPGFVRADCAKRYKAIRAKVPKLEGINVLDFGCAEGYFGFKFLLDGASSAAFIDNDDNCLKVVDQRALENGFATRAKIYNKIAGGHYDVALCLDLWGHGSEIPPVSKFKEIADILFISPAGNGSDKSPKLFKELGNYYGQVEAIYCGYENRTIFRGMN